MKKLLSIMAVTAMLCSLTVFTVGCGDAKKENKTEKKAEEKKTEEKKTEEKKNS